MIDSIDELILSALSKDAKQDLNEIWDFLRNYGHNLSLEEIDSRIKTLEDEKIISRYTISIDTQKVRHRIIRVVLVTFRPSQHLGSRIEGLKKYLGDAPFVLFSGKTRGGYDWITIQVFSSAEVADEESDIYRNLFGDIIQTYEVYDFSPLKEPTFNAFTYTDKEYKKFLNEWMPPFLGRR
ncbi:MAG: Lrp/AsnC family transcriptional regulator [Thermoproteota archaeon]|nr:Lrp/AsnC family transcriptional regulator [Nitrosopumilus sp.]MDQ3085160.1 Lrp/AsnC family transcriptional regulator [Thermoproteota archaeon]